MGFLKTVFLSLFFSLNLLSLAFASPLSYFDKIEVKEPVIVKNLEIFPLVSSVGNKLPQIYTLDEALFKDFLIVRETDEVNKLEVENRSNKYVFIMAGEIVSGGKQNRTLQEDLLLPPHSGKVIADVFCVEEGRWESKGDKFFSSSYLTNLGVRESALAAKKEFAQQNVWSMVESYSKEVGAKSRTYALDEILKSDKVNYYAGNYKKEFKGFLSEYPQARGVVVAIGGERILCIDLFEDRDLFVSLWDKLLMSYIAEAIVRENEKYAEIKKKDVIKFIEILKETEISRISTPGEGSLWKLQSEEIKGRILSFKDYIIHLVAFPGKEMGENEEDVPLYRQY